MSDFAWIATAVLFVPIIILITLCALGMMFENPSHKRRVVVSLIVLIWLLTSSTYTIMHIATWAWP